MEEVERTVSNSNSNSKSRSMRWRDVRWQHVGRWLDRGIDR
jgi:hypothetical protein